MKKIYLLISSLFSIGIASAQNPGLVISEILANPAGTDNAFEWVELVATNNIDFSVTPYSVVVCNNGTATTNGWIAGASLSYGFNITSGTVSTGDVVYVGGSTMLPTGTKLRTINVVTTAGDGFGNAAAGVFGNGGSNADGVAVFNLPVSSLTAATVPVDALFYGTAIGTALVNSGADGYQLPVNDRYSGGKLQSNSFFAGDPGSDVSIKATGFFNTMSDSWYGQRTWTTQTAVNDNATAITLGSTNPAGTASIATVTQTVSETAGTVTVNVSFANPNTDPAKVVFQRSNYSNAIFGTDYSWTNDTLTIPANTSGTFPYTIQLTDDTLAERTERIIVKMAVGSNVIIGATNYQIIYLTDNDYQNPTANNELSLNLLNSFSNGAEGTNSSEIVAFDPTTDKLYIANSVGAKLDIVNFSNPSAPVLENSIVMTPYGNINSLTVHNGIVATAVENTNPQLNGSVVFFDALGNFLNQVTVGAMPDMITFNNDFTKIVVACEGEPKTDYSIDPEGSVAIVDITPGIASLTNSNVLIANFQAYNGQEAALRAQGIRIFGPGSSAAQDLEPEYITLSDDNTTAYVSLQENNAMAVVNLQTGTVTAIRSLGLIDYNVNNGLDASDQTAGIYISSIPAKGTFMPDALAHATIGGVEYIFSANEGDAREYTAVTDVARLSATSLDSTAFPDQTILKNNQFLGRLNVLQATGDTDGDGDKDELHLLGSRSFSIWNAQTGALVFDSKDLIEQITATHPAISGLFNASNTSGTAVSKNRSDDKGPEPEGVATAFINGNHYLFVSMERVGGVMLFNIDNPAAPTYVGYYNNRSAATNGPDRGAEGIIIVKKEDSPNGKDLVILANEVSSTLSIFEINTCVDLAGATITASNDTICEGNSVSLTIPGNAQSTYQWLKNDVIIAGQTGTTLTVTSTGNYRVYASNTTLACADTTVHTTIQVLPLPVVVAGTNQSVCAGTSVTLNATGTQNYNWNNGISNGVAFIPSATTTYTVTGTDTLGCSNQAQVTVTVNPVPVANATADLAICAGETISLQATGGNQVNWSDGIQNNVSFTPLATNTYTAVVSNAYGCQDTAQTQVTVHSLPTISAGNDATICAGDSVLLNASGATTYQWSNGTSNGSFFAPGNSLAITVIGTDANGCEGYDQLVVNVNTLPDVTAGSDLSICAGTSIALQASGAQNYAWSDGIQNGQAFSPTATATYSVVGTDANGCENTAAITVTVNENPTVWLGNDTTTCANYGAILLDAGNGYSAYDWNTNATSQTVSAFISGTYEVTVTDDHGCSSTDAINVVIDPCLGIAENTATVSIYPNPTSGILTIDLGISAPAELKVYNAIGQLIDTLHTQEQTFQLDLSSYAKGTYSLTIEQSSNHSTHTVLLNY